MNIKFNYGTGVISIPESVMSGCLSRASKTDLCVLITLAATQKDDLDDEQVSALLKISMAELNSSVAFWRGAGIIACEDEKVDSPPPKKGKKTQVSEIKDTDKSQQKIPDEDKNQNEEAKEKRPQKVLAPAIEMPRYNTEQIIKFMETHKDMSELLDACQQTLGKIFNPAESSALIGMKDYLNMDSDYILLLMADCAKKNKKSLNYIEKLAISLHDAEITTYQALEEHLAMIDYLAEKETKIRSIFGINKRALSVKEKECFARWLTEFKYDIDIIDMAYNITINSIHEPSVPYTNAILDRWNAENLRTTEDIEKYLEENKKEKDHEKSSFNVDTFFDDAIKRSYKTENTGEQETE